MQIRSQDIPPLTEPLKQSASRQSNGKFYVVGIGASAGGLEALEKLFVNMPPDTGLAFVVIQHLSPDYKSLMVELLSKYTRMQVLRAEDGTPVCPDTVYLIPPKKNMTIRNGKLHLREKNKKVFINLPIDIFLKSLAKDQAELAVGIILSGTGSDGMRGVRSIKEKGGMVMVQEESSAKFNGMPRSAISTGVADYILSPEEMPPELLHFTSHRPDEAKPEPPPLSNTQDTIGRIIHLLRNQTGVDFTYYKPSTFHRRLERRLHVNQIDKPEEYLRFLMKSPREITALYKEILIGVTNFFRDARAFELVKHNAIPQIFDHHEPHEPIRVWVAGCSTGEEAYSLAMLFHEYVEDFGRSNEIKIFATDIDKDALDVASAGWFPESIAADVSPDRLQRFFTSSGDNYQINRQIREMVVFATHNLIKDPPFTRIDLISCRNLLIYLLPVLQKRILSLFSFALHQTGFLLLGNSETVGAQADHYRALDSKYKLYRLRSGTRPPPAHTLNLPDKAVTRPQLPIVAEKRNHAATHRDLLERICRALVSSHNLCCVVINAEYNLLYVFGEVRDYIRFTVGEATLDIRKLLPRELGLALTTALHRTQKDRQPFSYKDIFLGGDKASPTVELRVQMVDPVRGREPVFIVFIEKSAPPAAPDAHGRPFNLEEQTRQRLLDLERELQHTRENLQATIEELETSNEELQATNEELLSSNEQLQSTNEELQSVNEELYTVNTEYQNKIQELTDLNNDVNNLLRCTDIGTVFLDRDLKIRRFTPAVHPHFNIMAQDLGRPLAHLSHNLNYPDVVADTRFVLDSKQPVEKETVNPDGDHLLIRIFPYLNEDDHAEGVVVTVVDVSSMKQFEANLAMMAQEKDLILDSVSDLILYFNRDFEVVWANSVTFAALKRKPEQLVGSKWHMVWATGEQSLAQSGARKAFESGEVQTRSLTAADGRQWRLKDVPIKDDNGRVRAIVEFAHNSTPAGDRH